MKKNILVFPCGSEIGLEIYRSLQFSLHFNLIGASSVKDHGIFVYKNYIGSLPFINEDNFINALREVIQQHQIDAIYPAMDEVIFKLKLLENDLECKVIASLAPTTEICYSKSKTYQHLQEHILVNTRFQTPAEIVKYPVFLKPDIGYGSRGAMKIINQDQLRTSLLQNPNSLILKYLPGDEYTIDCFTDRHRQLRFTGPRKRARIVNGISVNTATLSETDNGIFEQIAIKINSVLELRGAWFFQCKEDEAGKMVLMEVASRLGGSSSVYRCQGINFALLTCFDAFDMDVSFVKNDFSVELDRALDNRYKVAINYSTVYVDLDDTLIIDGEVNVTLIKFLYQCVNQSKKLILITKHSADLDITLKKFRLQNLFDSITHLEKSANKHEYCIEPSSIFIDDSFAERKAIYERCNIPVFAPDAIESLLKD